VASAPPLVLGHLGNTLDAFARSRSLDADGVELDVRRAGDGSLVVHHDPLIEGVGPILDLDRGSLPAHIPLLDDALHQCAGMIVNVEIKNLPVDPDYDPTEEIVRLVLAAIDATGAGPSVIISSFSLATVDAARAADPTLRTAFLTLPAWDQRRAVAAAAERGHSALHPHRRSLDAALVDLVHGTGMAIHPWAVDDAASATQAHSLGVDAIITDDPAAVLPALRS
jgi:glycerophosphoryl diester phosphodiesterase